MARLLVGDDNGWMSADIEVQGSVLSAALQHEDAESIVSCAIMVALSVLAADEEWPNDFRESLARFISSMLQTVRRVQLM